MAQTKTSAANKAIKERAAKLRAVRAEELRETMQGKSILTRLENIDAEYMKIYKTVSTLKSGVSESKARQIKLRLEALGKSADLNFKKLRKLLPDMSHVDFEDSNGNSIFEAFTQAVSNGIDKARALPNEEPSVPKPQGPLN